MHDIDASGANEGFQHTALDDLIDHHHEHTKGRFRNAPGQRAADCPDEPVVPAVWDVKYSILVSGKQRLQLSLGTSVNDEPRLDTFLT